MKKLKGFLRKHWFDLIFVLGFTIAVINFVCGTKTFISYLVLFLYCIDTILIYGTPLIRNIEKKIIIHKILKIYKQNFDDLKRVHRIRYKLYFNGTQKEIEQTSKVIEEVAKRLISYGEDGFVRRLLNSKQLEYIESCEEIIKQMLTTKNPNMIKSL